MANEHTFIHPASIEDPLEARPMSDEDPEDEDALPARKKEMGRKRKRTIATL
uniref:Adenosine deaminase RNA specific B1 n=1 Tax=Gorilla gorilla gorilla TaxID=9595 RepID=A0A2I2ZHD3_GORGO